jgi:hypothetical protein
MGNFGTKINHLATLLSTQDLLVDGVRVIAFSAIVMITFASRQGLPDGIY